MIVLTLLYWIIIMIVILAVFLDLYIRKKMKSIVLVDADPKKPKVLPMLTDPLLNLFTSFYAATFIDKNNALYLKDVALKYEKDNIVKATQMTFFGRPVIATWNVEQFKEILVSNKEAFGKSPIFVESFNSLFKESVVVVEGEQWKHQRKIMNPSFKFDRLKIIVPSFVNVAERLLLQWNQEMETKNTDKICIHGWLSKMTIEALGKGGFGFDFKALEGGLTKPYQDYQALLKGFGTIFRIFSWYEKLPLASNKEYDQAIVDFHKWEKQIINEKREKISKSTADSDSDLLDMLVRSFEDDGLTESELMHNIFLFFLAGHETSSGTLCFILHYLAHNQDVQDKLRAQVNEALGNDKPSYDGLKKLDYMDKVIKESMRLSGPVAALNRTATKDTKLGGYYVPKGTLILLLLEAAMRDEANYKDADKFIPERWNNPQRSAGISWLPFGAGPRSCIGNQFALLEMKTALSLMMQNYKFHPGTEPLKLPRGITYRVHDDYNLRLEKLT